MRNLDNTSTPRAMVLDKSHLVKNKVYKYGQNTILFIRFITLETYLTLGFILKGLFIFCPIGIYVIWLNVILL